MQVILQNRSDGRHRRAQGPSLGLSSTIREERKQNERYQTASEALRHRSAVLLPWKALYQLGRVIWLGFAVTFGGTPSASNNTKGRRT